MMFARDVALDVRFDVAIDVTVTRSEARTSRRFRALFREPGDSPQTNKPASQERKRQPTAGRAPPTMRGLGRLAEGSVGAQLLATSYALPRAGPGVFRSSGKGDNRRTSAGRTQGLSVTCSSRAVGSVDTPPGGRGRRRRAGPPPASALARALAGLGRPQAHRSASSPNGCRPGRPHARGKAGADRR